MATKREIQIPNPQDFAKKYKAFLEKARQKIEELPENLPPDVLVVERRERLDRLNQRLQASERTREQAVARFDAEIAELKNRIEVLEGEISQDSKLTADDATKSRTPAKKATRRKKKG